MMKREIKIKIRELIETIPEEHLEGIYQYIQSLKDVPPETIQKTRSLSKIISEDRELLKKLAK